MRFLRAAGDHDRSELEAFQCARPGVAFEEDIETFVHGLLDWREDPAGMGREILVLEDDDEITGVVAFEDDDGDVFINALAVRIDCQGHGRGIAMLQAVLAELGQGLEVVVTWLVHPANFASHAMSYAVGAEVVYPPEDRPFARYVIQV